MEAERGSRLMTASAEGRAATAGAARGDQATPAAVVRAAGVTRRFGSRTILDEVDLAIGEGEFVALLGRSGTGKSTLLRILAGLDKEWSGSIRVPRDRSVVFQDPRLLPWQRVLANVVLGVRSGDARERGQRALEEVGLGDRQRSWPATLSGGEAQRAALARALVREPRLLLLDEPFGALDALTRLRMHALLAELCRVHRPSVLLVTHDVDEAIALADRVTVLDQGRIAFDRTVDLPTPRDRHLPAFTELRAELLGALGVTARV
jgi:sulfonate transport system ATP-binding protein